MLQPPGRAGGRLADATKCSTANPAVESVAIDGPYAVEGPGDTPSRRTIFVVPARGSAAEEAACARRILSTLARRAYRRPVTDAEVETLLGFYAAGRQRRQLRRRHPVALERILVDPNFLFRVERDPAERRAGRRRIASAISSWRRGCRSSSGAAFPTTSCSSWPSAGQLKDPAVLEQQVRRMLADSALEAALVDNFAGQWLQLRNFASVAPTIRTFPDFDENLREAFQRETELFVDSQLREDRSVVELLTANYTFVNERLARHYGIPNVYGDRFRRVTFADDEQRGGLLGQGSMLTVTSYPEPHVAGAARQVAAREHPRHAAAAAAAGRAGAAGARRGRQAGVGARAARAAPEEPGVREPATRRWIRWASRSRTSTRSGAWRHDERGRRRRSTRRARCPTAPGSRARRACGRCC